MRHSSRKTVGGRFRGQPWGKSQKMPTMQMDHAQVHFENILFEGAGKSDQHNLFSIVGCVEEMSTESVHRLDLFFIFCPDLSEP